MRWAGAAAVIALATWLRLWRLDLAEFKNDEAGWLRRAEDVLRLGQLPLVGEGSSLQVPAPPDFIYLLAPIVALSRDPHLASAAIGLANAAGVAGTMLLGWRAFSPVVGLAAGLAYAANPWSVFFGRKVWNPEIVAPLAVLFFIALDRGVIGRRAIWAAAAFPILTLAIQMHGSVAALTPLLLSPAFVLLRRRLIGHLVVGLGVAALIASPYLVYISRNWSEMVGVESALTHAGAVDSDGATRIVGLTGGWDNWYIDGVHLEFLLPGRLASAPGRVETILLALGLVIAVFLTAIPRKVPTDQRLRLAGILLWIVLPVVLTIRHAFPLYDHYFLFAGPAGALLIGVGIQRVANQWRRVGLVVAAGLIFVAAIQVALVLRELDFLAVGYAPAYGPTLTHSKSMARDVAQFGAASHHLSVEFAGLDSEPIAYLARPFFPVVDLADVGSIGLGDSSHADGEGMTLLKSPERVDIDYEDGVHVLATAVSARARPGEQVALTMSWVAEGAPPAELVWDVALLDPRGRQVARGSGIRHHATPGDVVVSWFTLAIPAESPVGAFTARVSREDQAASEFMAGTIDVFRG